MATPTVNLERERLLQLAEEYRNNGYEVAFHPGLEDLPDLLRNYRPDMIARRGDEAVIVEVKSRHLLGSSQGQYLQDLAQAVEQNPGWRFELVMANPEDVVYPQNTEGSLQKHEIEARLQVAKQFASQHSEPAILYSWALAEAALRLVSEHEGLSLKRSDSLYLVKQLVIEGVISRSEYQLLMDSLSLRNTVAHGFKTTRVTQELVHELIDLIEQLLGTLHTSSDAD